MIDKLLSNTTLLAAIGALVMAVWVWWSQRSDRNEKIRQDASDKAALATAADAAAFALEAKETRAAMALEAKEARAAAALEAKEDRDRRLAKADRDELAEELATKLKASQLAAVQQATHVVAEELGTQGRRDAQTARSHQDELVAEQQRGTKVLSDQLTDAALARKAADEKADATAQELARNTAVTKDVASELAKNTDITKTAADGQQALLDQVSLVNGRVDQAEVRTAAVEARLELFARSHAAAHLTEGHRITAEIDAPPPTLKEGS